MDLEEKKVEAILFAVGREITTERIASYVLWILTK